MQVREAETLRVRVKIKRRDRPERGEREFQKEGSECQVGERQAEEGRSRLGVACTVAGQAELRAGARAPRMGPGPGVAGHGETPGPARGAPLRLQECHHGCKKHLGDIISFFFRFISGNLARGEGCFDRTSQGSRRSRFGTQDC